MRINTSVWNKGRKRAYIRPCRDCNKLYHPFTKRGKYCNLCLNRRTSHKYKHQPVRVDNRVKNQD